MLYVYTGFSQSEIKESQKKINKNFEESSEELFPTEEDIQSFGLDFFVESAPLFSPNKIVYIPLTEKTRTLVEEKVSLMRDMSDIFVLSTLILNAVQKKLFAKEGIEIFAKLDKPVSKKEEASIFPLLDFIVARDKKGAWIELQKLYEKNVSPEMIIPLLLWQIKLIIIARFSGEKNTPESIAKAFPLSKANRATKYTKRELLDFYKSIMTAFNQSRTSNRNLSNDLEKILLTNL